MLLKQPEKAKFPEVIFDGTIVRMWHLTDVSFEVPKAHLYLQVHSPKAYDSPQSAVLNRWEDCVSVSQGSCA